MREILFKAKRIDNGEWVEGIPIKTHIGLFIVFEENPHYCSQYGYMEIDGLIRVDENTLCQYTGLTDKNGCKIWENDVVKYHFGNDVAPIRFGKYQSCFDSVLTGHIGFYVDWDSKNALRKDLGYWVNMIDCNVIGNIFDNPELFGV